MASFMTRIAPQCGQSLGGVKRVWLADKRWVQDYTYLNDDLGIIDMILTSQGTPSSFLEFECDGEFVSADESLVLNQAGRSFPQKIILRFAAMEKSKRAVLESMIYARLACVFEDYNGRLWLLGQEFGLKATEYNGTTQARLGGNAYTCTLIGNERMQMREVNKTNFVYTFPNGIGSSRPTGSPLPPPPVNPKVTGLGGSGPNGGITEFLDSWIGPAASGSIPMPLSQLGTTPIKDLIQ